MNTQGLVSIYKLTVDSIRYPSKVQFEQDSQYINWAEVQRQSGVRNANKPYRFYILDNLYAFAYPGQDSIVVWNVNAGADKSTVIKCDRPSSQGSSACGKRVLSLGKYPSDSFYNNEARLVYSSRKSNSVLAVNMVELGPEMGGLAYKSLFKSDLRVAAAQFESKKIAFTKYGGHLVFEDADGYWKVYLLAGYNQKYVPAFTPTGRMLQASMTPTENVNKLFQPAHLV